MIDYTGKVQKLAEIEELITVYRDLLTTTLQLAQFKNGNGKIARNRLATDIERYHELIAERASLLCT